MHSALAFARSAATASCTLVPSRTVVLRRAFPAHRFQSRHFAAPLFSYSLARSARGTNRFSRLPAHIPLYFHMLTTLLAANPFVLTIVRIPPGCRDQARQLLPFFSVRSVSLWHIHSFHTLAASFPAPKKSTPLQSSKSSLFFGNTRGG